MAVGNAALNELLSGLWSIPIDRTTIPQHMLNLEQRERVSLLPWRGQCSPGLIEVLLDAYAPSRARVLDPFMGSGTALIESGRKSLEAFGVDVNPAAVHIARTAELMNLGYCERAQVFTEAEKLLKRTLNGPLLSVLRDLAEAATRNRIIGTVVANTIMQATGNGNDMHLADSLWHAFHRYQRLVADLPCADRGLVAEQGDARRLPLTDESVDVIVTSPPYINVFNYHQNYRKAMELLGWSVFDVSRAEIGANRKHRQNRFLTVI